MIFNKKYKCPVCSEESITLRAKLGLDGETLNRNILDCNDHITCRSCNARLIYKKTSDIKSIIILILYLSWGALLFISDPLHTLVFFIGYPLIILYQALFEELEEYIPPIPKAPQEPKFNLNKFLDNLKNSNCEK